MLARPLLLRQLHRALLTARQHSALHPPISPSRSFQTRSPASFRATTSVLAAGPGGITKQFKLADIGEGITECEIVKWFVTPSQSVVEFDPVVEVMSDKATVEITSPFTGRIENLCGAVGDVIRVGSVLCDVVTSDSEEPFSVPLPATTVHEYPYSSELSPPETFETFDSPRVLTIATPSTRRIARENGIDLGLVKGSGRDGRVTKGDVMSHVASGGVANTVQSQEVIQFVPIPPPLPSSTPLTSSASAIPLSPIRRSMFRAMASTLSIPHFSYSETIDVTSLEKLRLSLNHSIPLRYRKTLTPAQEMELSHRHRSLAEFGSTSDPQSLERVPGAERYDRLTLLPLLLKALSAALESHPIFLCSLSPGATEPTLAPRATHDISLALSPPPSVGSGLFTPVLPSVHLSSPYSLASQITTLIHHSSISSPPKFPLANRGSGTITLSNVGVVGGRFTAPIIPPTGQLVIGALGRVRVTPVYKDAKAARKVALDDDDLMGIHELQLVPRLMMDVTFSADHRVVEGVELARFVNDWKEIVESPERLVGLGQ